MGPCTTRLNGAVIDAYRRSKRLGLLANSDQGQPRGESNAWTLTSQGERVTAQLNLPQPVHEDGDVLRQSTAHRIGEQAHES
jgi:hypothetical protein